MENEHGLTRSSINLRTEPDLKSHITEAFGPGEPVEILEEAGNMLKVRPTRWEPTIAGFVLKSAIVINKETPDIFPKIKVGPEGKEIPAVPPALTVAEFLAWLDSTNEPPWLPDKLLRPAESGGQSSIGAHIRQVIESHRAEWDAWLSEIKTNDRQGVAAIDEWLVALGGGRELWSFRPERIFQHPSQGSVALGWVTPKDILLWTGRVHYNNLESKYQTWYEVELTKLDREIKGWYKASLLEEFIFPDAINDPTVPENGDTVFDLSRPLLRLPADKEIEQAKARERAVAQYIDVKEAIGWNQINHNLCGEFCVAALCGIDVIPFLQKWLASYRRAQQILEKDEGTSTVDLQAMLEVFNKKYEFFRSEVSVAPITPGYLRSMLDTGKMAIVGVGITRSGALKLNSRIRHWVVIEDIIRVGNSGWVRLYNPFPDREEVYTFDVVFDSSSRSGLGLWVEPTYTETGRGENDPGKSSV